MVLGALLDIFFPLLCPLCRDSVGEDERGKGFCGSCAQGMTRVSGPLCTVCGTPFVSKVGSDRLCEGCSDKAPPFVKARGVLHYDGAALDAVHRFKYLGDVSLARAFGEMMVDEASSMGELDLVVPVPLHRERLKQRGFNQSLLLARRIARRLSLPVDYMSLKRVRSTLPQIEFKADERLKNVKHAFKVEDPGALKNKRVLLVDDVYTTGATVTECAKVVKGAGAEVFVLTLARVVRL